MRARWSFAVVAFALLGRPAQAGQPTLDDVGPRVRGILGDAVVQGLLRARRAEAIPLEEMRTGGINPPPPEAPGKPGTIHGYRPAGKARPLDTVLLDQFRTALLDSDTYSLYDLPPNTGTSKMCGGFRPGVAIRFWGDVRGRPVPVDALLCFNCGDVVVVEGEGTPPTFPHDASAGEGTLLRLASAALPDEAELAARLEERLNDRARELLFRSMFPARTQVAMTPTSGRVEFERPFADHHKYLAAEATRLRKSVEGPSLFATVARAFAALQAAWSNDSTTLAALAVSQLPARDVEAGWKRIQGDQLALAGVAELDERRALDRNVPSATRQAWLPITAEAAITQSPHVALCPLMARVAALPAAAGRSLLGRVARGEIEAAPRGRRGFPERASARGCALLALTKVDATLAATQARAWSPVDPVDQAAKRVVLYLTGDTAALDGNILGVASNAVADGVFEPLRAHPTRATLDLVVGLVAAQPTDYGVSRVQRLLEDVASAKFPLKLEASPEQRAATLKEWWTAHAAAWTPPKTPR
jgi:hypothetical protein